MVVRLTRRLWTAGVALFAAGVLLIAGSVLAETVAVTPRAAVRQYFAALQRRDTSRLIAMDHGLQPRSYALEVIQSRDYLAPDDVGIRDITVAGKDRRSVQVSYKINNRRFASAIQVVRNDSPNLVGFRPWHPTGTLGGVQLQGALFAKPKINGRPVPPNTDAVPPLLPGGYRITNAPNPLAYIPDLRVAVPVGAASPAKLEPKLKPDAGAKIKPLVDHYVDRCVSSLAAGAPDQDCTFLKRLGVRGGETVVVGSYPKIKLRLDDDVTTVYTAARGSLTISSDRSDQDQQRRYAVAGFVYLDSNNVPIFSPRS